MSNLYRGPLTDASYQILIHLAKRLQRKRFVRNQPIRDKNCLWRPCLITDRGEMSKLYRGPAIDASYQVSVSRKLTEEEKDNLEGEIGSFEAGKILKKMKNNKSPGSDGFTSEFLKFVGKI